MIALKAQMLAGGRKMIKYIHMLTLALALTVAATLTFGIGKTALAGNLDYTHGGKNFSAHFEKANAASDVASKGVVFIIHDWDGLTEYEVSRAKMLAGLGYDAVAIDLFGVDAVLEGRDDYRRETGALYGNREEFRARINAAVKAGKDNATNPDKVVIIGYCFGGAGVLEAARAGMDVDGFVSFHGGLKTPQGQDYSNTPAPVLILHGSADPVSGMDDLDALLGQLKAANVPHDSEVYDGARHSFTVPGSRDYDAEADAKSWDALGRFLSELG
jgi:dienelactone hydrolase